VTVLELPQGYYADLTGMTWDDAMQMFKRDDEQFLRAYPHTRCFHRARCRELEVDETRTAPWGHEWYVADEAGKLRMHSAHYDSSG
jgi:hypothetical protein